MNYKKNNPKSCILALLCLLLGASLVACAPAAKAPVLQEGVESGGIVQLKYGEEYALDLSTVFRSPDGSALRYECKQNMGEFAPVDEQFTCAQPGEEDPNKEFQSVLLTFRATNAGGTASESEAAEYQVELLFSAEGNVHVISSQQMPVAGE